MARIAGEFAFDVFTGNPRSTSQDLTSQHLHFNGFDYQNKFKMMGVGDTVCLYAQGPPIRETWDLVLEPDGALDGICKTLGFGVDTGDICELDSTRAYCIYLQGVAPGTGTLYLRNEKTRAVVDKLEVQVVSNRMVEVCFYNLRDKSTREGCSEYLQRKHRFVSGPDLNTVVAHVNYIVQRQANVRMSLRGGYANHSPLRVLNVLDLDLGENPDIDFLNTKVFGRPGFDGNADYHVCWIWGSSIRGDRAATNGNVTILVAPTILKRPSEPDFVRTIAHEYVHFLCGSKSRGGDSHDSNQTDLMFTTSPHGVMLRKERLKKIVR